MVESPERRAHNESSSGGTVGLRTYAYSEASSKHPLCNQDMQFSYDRLGVGVICDGLGKSKRAEVASLTAAMSLAVSLSEIPQSTSVSMAETAMRRAFEKANETVKITAPEGRTTATAYKVILNEGQRYLVFGHLGDTRLGILRDGELIPLTTDHTVACDANPKLRDIFDRITSQKDLSLLSEEERVLYKHRSKATRKLGEYFEPEIGSIRLLQGDVIVRTSDGIHDVVAKKELEAILGNPKIKIADKPKAVADISRSRSRGHVKSGSDDIAISLTEVLALAA